MNNVFLIYFTQELLAVQFAYFGNVVHIGSFAEILESENNFCKLFL